MVFAYWELAANFLLGIAWPLVVLALGWRFAPAVLSIFGDREFAVETPLGKLSVKEALSTTDVLMKRDQEEKQKAETPESPDAESASLEDLIVSNSKVEVVSSEEPSAIKRLTQMARLLPLERPYAVRNTDLMRQAFDLLEERLRDMASGLPPTAESPGILSSMLAANSSTARENALHLAQSGVISHELVALVGMLASLRNAIVHADKDTDFFDTARFVDSTRYCLEELDEADRRMKSN